MAPKTVERQSFYQERDRLEADVAAFEAKLLSNELSATELSALPGQIAETRAALQVIKARIDRFKVEDLQAEMSEVVAAATSERAVLMETTAEAQLHDEWWREHMRLFQAGSDDPAEVERLVELYSRMLHGLAKNKAAHWRMIEAFDRARDLRAELKLLGVVVAA